MKLFFCALLLAVPVLQAQEFRATITGQVMDPTGAAIPAATVTAVNTDTGQAFSAKADSVGVFSILYLLPAKYTITVEAPGFQKMFYNNVVLESAQKLNLPVTLKLGSVDQAITVTADPGLLDTATASVGGVIDQTKVENMPSTGRQVWMDLAFGQGIRMTSGDGFNTTPRNNSDRYQVNGSPTNSNAFFINGAPVSNQGAWYFVPNQDAVQELQGGTSYDAQQGRAAGGSFNVNVKSGTGKYRGSLYENYGSEKLYATRTQDNLYGIHKTLDRQHTFGGVIGGPVRKDKTFFFASYEGFRQHGPVASVSSVPPLDWRKGDFSQSGYNIYDPLTATCVRTNAQGQCSQYARSQFPGNVIPANRISRIGQAIMDLYPEPKTSGINANYAIPGDRDFRYDQLMGRVDHSISASTRLYGLFTYQGNLAHNRGNGFPNVANTGNVPSGRDYNAIVDLTKVLSPALVLDMKVSFGRFTNHTVSGSTLEQNFTGDKIGGLQMPLVPTTTHLNIVPEIDVTNYTSLFGNTSNGTVESNWDFTASLVHMTGRHSLHYGFDAMTIQSADSGIPGQPNGTFTFNVGPTQSNPQAATIGQGLGAASLLLGYPTGGSVSWNSNYFVSYHYYALYAQDDIKLRKNLTLNLGLRWDVNTSPFERFNRINGGFCYTCQNPLSSQIDYAKYANLQKPLLGGLQFAGVDAARGPYNTEWNHWQPRFGISWAIAPKLVMRAGYGMYYSFGRIGTNSMGFNRSTSYVTSLDGGITPTDYFRSGRPYPNGVLAPTNADLGLATNAGQGITYSSLSRRIPMSQHWSLGLQRELPKQILLDVEYVGSHTHAMGVSTNEDGITLAQQQACFQDNAICNTNVPNPFYGVVPAAAGLGASTTVQAWQLMRPYPLFNGITESDTPMGESDYHALQVRVERKISTINFVANYTYSNWMNENSWLNSGNFQDAKIWRGLDSADRRHYVSANLVWPLPIGKNGIIATNATGWKGALINHWMVNSTIIWGGGTPVAIPGANFYGPGCTSYAPPDGQNAQHWLNNDMNCWHNLKSWEARTAPLRAGYLRNPDQFVWNPAIHKRFALPREGMFVQFRAEALNGANHPTFGGPNTNVGTKPRFTQWVGWTGFGTLPLSQNNKPRTIILSMKLLF